jgi:hypothetical protein
LASARNGPIAAIIARDPPRHRDPHISGSCRAVHGKWADGSGGVAVNVALAERRGNLRLLQRLIAELTFAAPLDDIPTIEIHRFPQDSKRIPAQSTFLPTVCLGYNVAMSRWKWVAVSVAVLYAVPTMALWFVMRSPPEQFGQVMKHVPTPMMMVLPFQTLWLWARAGTIRVGDSAPDFHLETIDRQQHVQLSAERGRPVVLIFGSYT